MAPNPKKAERSPVVAKDAPKSTTAGDKKPVLLQIDDQWYDLTQWQHTHPGGAEIFEKMNHGDVTDAFYALHSKEAIARLQRLPKTVAPADAPQPDAVTKSFREFRKQLEADGYFDRNVAMEIFYPAAVLALYVVAALIANDHPWIAIFLLGVGMEQAGWLGHDYAHGRGPYCWNMARFIACVLNGFSPHWWSRKHNTHHAYPNWMGVDDDIANDPIFHLWYPAEEKDHPMRKYQHLYFVPVVSALYASWRLQSIQWVMASGDKLEAGLIALGYIFLVAVFPIHVWVGAIFFGGWLVGIVVTASHQSEKLIEESEQSGNGYNFVRDQFSTTRDALTTNPVLNWMWGGMQYQLEHHLFPIMPKYYYGAVAPMVEKWAAKQDVEYKADGIWQILSRNLSTMKKYAQTVEDKKKN